MSGGNSFRGKFYGEETIFLGGNFPRVELSAGQFSLGALILGVSCPGGNHPVGNHPVGNHPVGNSPRAIFLGGNCLRTLCLNRRQVICVFAFSYEKQFIFTS